MEYLVLGSKLVNIALLPLSLIFFLFMVISKYESSATASSNVYEPFVITTVGVIEGVIFKSKPFV